MTFLRKLAVCGLIFNFSIIAVMPSFAVESSRNSRSVHRGASRNAWKTMTHALMLVLLSGAAVGAGPVPAPVPVLAGNSLARSPEGANWTPHPFGGNAQSGNPPSDLGFLFYKPYNFTVITPAIRRMVGNELVTPVAAEPSYSMEAGKNQFVSRSSVLILTDTAGFFELRACGASKSVTGISEETFNECPREAMASRWGSYLTGGYFPEGVQAGDQYNIFPWYEKDLNKTQEIFGTDSYPTLLHPESLSDTQKQQLFQNGILVWALGLNPRWVQFAVDLDGGIHLSDWGSVYYQYSGSEIPREEASSFNDYLLPNPALSAFMNYLGSFPDEKRKLFQSQTIRDTYQRIANLTREDVNHGLGLLIYGDEGVNEKSASDDASLHLFERTRELLHMTEGVSQR